MPIHGGLESRRPHILLLVAGRSGRGRLWGCGCTKISSVYVIAGKGGVRVDFHGHLLAKFFAVLKGDQLQGMGKRSQIVPCCLTGGQVIQRVGPANPGLHNCFQVSECGIATRLRSPNSHNANGQLPYLMDQCVVMTKASKCCGSEHFGVFNICLICLLNFPPNSPLGNAYQAHTFTVSGFLMATCQEGAPAAWQALGRGRPGFEWHTAAAPSRPRS